MRYSTENQNKIQKLLSQTYAKKKRQSTTERSKANSYITIGYENKSMSRAMTALIVETAQTIFMQKEKKS